jgi:hemerythrin-like domain-containing protein
MSTSIPSAVTDTRDMLLVHTVLRREFRLAEGAVRAVADRDTERAEQIAAHVRLLLSLLHVHHGGEDRLLWPLLLQRAPGELALIQSMEDQHHRLDTTIGTLEQALGRWANSADVSDQRGVAAQLGELCAALDEHLLAEERDLLPLAARHVTPSEWARLAQEVKQLPVPVLPIAFGMLMYHGDPDVVAVILAQAPMLPRLLLPYLAPRVYARYARRIHGTPTP